VIDASAGVELLMRSEHGRVLDEKLDRNVEWWVPEHYFVEVMNVLRRTERTERHGPRRLRVAAAIHVLWSEDLIGASLRPLLVAAWVRRGHLTIGDAFYVALAEAVGATLVTADLRLAKAPGLPVPVITP
jgi:predicted nucleic acid-binding protein